MVLSKPIADFATNLILKWKETYELSFELAEVNSVLLDMIVGYCDKNNIPLHNEKGLWNLVQRARILLKQIEEVNSPDYKPTKYIVSDGITQPKKPDKDYTVPFLNSFTL